jgi:hypothetical protein
MENEFIDGLMVKKPNEKAPEFIIANISIKREELIEWLQGKNEEWINADIKVSKEKGTYYASVNNWKPKSGEQKEEEVKITDVPF